MPLEGDRLLLNGASAGPFCGAVIAQGFPTEMYCVKGGATEYIHDWKFICGRMTRSERRAIDQQGETEAGASGDELGAPFFFGPLLSVYTYSHRQLLVAVWPAAIIRPLGAAPLGGASSPVYTSRRRRRLVHRTQPRRSPGAWGTSVTNKRHGVYTCALLVAAIMA